MRRLAGSAAALLWLATAAAFAARTTEVATRAARRPLQVALTTVPETTTCAAGTAAPLPVRDASDPLWFASGPTAQLDMEELHSAQLAPLASVVLLGRTLRLFVFGAPAGTPLRFTRAGWQPRWPFC